MLCSLCANHLDIESPIRPISVRDPALTHDFCYRLSCALGLDVPSEPDQLEVWSALHTMDLVETDLYLQSIRPPGDFLKLWASVLSQLACMHKENPI